MEEERSTHKNYRPTEPACQELEAPVDNTSTDLRYDTVLHLGIWV